MVVVLLAIPLTSIAEADPTQTAKTNEAMDRALTYLQANYDEVIGLIHECPIVDDLDKGNTYWIYSDNFLASLALNDSRRSNGTHKQMAENIRENMSRYLNGTDPLNPYMVLNQSGNESVFKAMPPEGTFLSQISPAEIRTHQIDPSAGALNEGSTDYADIAFLKAIYYWEGGDKAKANECYDGAIEDPNSTCYLDNGTGFIDRSYTENYQTYKLALYIIASEWLGREYDLNLLNRLVDMQQPEGGFRTGYDANFTPKALNNTETTSLVILALNSSISGQEPLSWVYYALPIAVLIAIAAWIIWLKRPKPDEGKRRP